MEIEHRLWLVGMASRRLPKLLKHASKAADRQTRRAYLDRFDAVDAWLKANSECELLSDRDASEARVTTILHDRPDPVVRASVAREASGTMTIEGHAGVYYNGDPQTEFRMSGNVVERIQAPAFADVLKRQAAEGHDLFCVLGHDWNVILGSCHAGTMSARADKTGLHFTCELPKSAAREQEAIARGDLRNASIGFTCSDDDIDFGVEDSGRTMVATIKGFRRLYECSPCLLGAYPGAYVRPLAGQGVRSVDDVELQDDLSIRDLRWARYDAHDRAKEKVRQWELEQAALWDSLRARRFE